MSVFGNDYPCHYITRQKGNLDLPSYRIEYGSQSFKVVGAKLWKRLENETQAMLQMENNRELHP